MHALLLSLLLAQAPLVPRAGFTTDPARPLLTEDSGTVMHVIWTGSGYRDLHHVPWLRVGRPPLSPPELQVISTGRNAGPFSDMDYWTITGSPAGTDVLDFAGDFTCRIIFTANTLTGLKALLVDGQYGSSGEGWSINAAAQGNFVAFDTYAASSAFTEADSGNGFSLHVPVIASAGRSGSNMKVKVNGATTKTVGSALTVRGTNSEARFGRADTSSGFFDGTVHEAECSTTAWNESAEATAHTAFASQRNGVDDFGGQSGAILDCRNYPGTGDWNCGSTLLTKGTQGPALPTGYCGSGVRGLTDSAASFDGVGYTFYSASAGLVPAQTGDFTVSAVVQATQTALAEGIVIGRNFGGNQWALEQLLGHWKFLVYSAVSFTYVDLGAVTVGTPQVIVVSYTTATGHVDAKLDTATVSATAVHPINPVTPYTTIGSDLTTYWPGKGTRFDLWQQTFTPAQQTAMVTVERAKLGCTQRVVCALGDSITYGLNTTAPYPTVLRQLLNPGNSTKWAVGNSGLASDDIAGATGRFHAGLEGCTDLLIEIGVNDILAGTDAATTWAALKALIDEAHGYGINTFTGKITPCKSYSGSSAGKQTVLATVNASIAAYSASTTVVDINTPLNDGSGNLKAQYDSGDGLHPNTAGAALMAATFKAAVSP